MKLSLPPVEYMRLVCGDVPDLQGEFDRVGRALVRGLERTKLLEPRARLLDIGCGCGRVARHLTDSAIAKYSGFDRHPGMIEWARSHIGSMDDRFEFRHADVESGYEELDDYVGTISPTEFIFPYDDRAFTGALAASVFTHIDFPATSHYLAESARVLAPGGGILASFFPGDTTGSMGESNRNFVIREEDLRQAIEQAGLEVLLLDSGRPSTGQSFFLLGKPEA